MKTKDQRPEFILKAAADAGIGVWVDNGELLVMYPRKLPEETCSSFSAAFSKHQPEIVRFIQENRLAREGGDA